MIGQTIYFYLTIYFDKIESDTIIIAGKKKKQESGVPFFRSFLLTPQGKCTYNFIYIYNLSDYLYKFNKVMIFLHWRRTCGQKDKRHPLTTGMLVMRYYTSINEFSRNYIQNTCIKK